MENNGSMRISSGKMSICFDGEWKDFGVDYVASDMRRIAKLVKGHKSYAQIILKWAALLERNGVFGIRQVQGLIKPFFGASENWMARDCKIWHGWLQQIWQFRNCTGKKDEPVHKEANRNFRSNFDTVFNSETLK